MRPWHPTSALPDRLNKLFEERRSRMPTKITTCAAPSRLLLVAGSAFAVAASTLAPAVGAAAVEPLTGTASTIPAWQRDIGRFGAAEVSPVDMQKDLHGDWWVIDEGLACIKKYAPDLTTVKLTVFTCGQLGKDATHMGRARGLGLDRRTGQVWVADTPTHRILKLANDGTLLFSSTLPAATGGPLNSPADVAVDDVGNAYVPDQKDRIIKVSPGGVVLGQVGASGSGVGRMRNVMSIEYSAVGGPHFYTTDSRNYQVDKWTTWGSNVASFGKQGTADGQATKDARGIAIDPAGTIYVADVGSNRIIRFDRTGVPLPSLGNGLPFNRTGGRDLAYGARGLYVDGSRLAVADMWNARVLFWTLTGSDTGEHRRPPGASQ